jgi:carbamate kinase
VVDKDPAAGLLAREIDADGFLMLTDTDAVYEEWGTDAARAIARAPPGPMRGLELPAGSMGPKVEAACDFVEARSGFAAIGRLQDAGGLADGSAGTRIDAEATRLEYRSGGTARG